MQRWLADPAHHGSVMIQLDEKGSLTRSEDFFNDARERGVAAPMLDAPFVSL
jgi:hypothetical protein